MASTYISSIVTQSRSAGYVPQVRPCRTAFNMAVWCGIHLVAALIVSTTSVASAHNGPPFPIFENKQVGPCLISVWTNPDVGTGVFFVMVDPLPQRTIPSDLTVEVSVQPVGGRLPERKYQARREDLRGQVEYKVDVPFDAQGPWHVRTLLSSSQGKGDFTADVQVTPPGLGRWDLLLYLLPFAGIGFLWFRAVISRAKRRTVFPTKGITPSSKRNIGASSPR